MIPVLLGKTGTLESQVKGLDTRVTALEAAPAPSGGALVVHATGESLVLDKTWQEIYDSDLSVVVVSSENDKKIIIVNEVYLDSDVYTVEGVGNYTFTTDSASGYPSSREVK